MPGSEEEWGKTLTGLLLEGTVSAFCIDNIEQILKSGKFSSFLTTPGWKERILGSNSMPELEQRTIPMATGNNIMLGGDIPRRCYRITLDAGISTPWQRDNFTYVPLIDHIRANRGKIIAALLTLVRAWYVEGQPKPGKKVAFQDDFAEWARITSGVLAFTGIDGFLENLIDMYEKADVDGNAWTRFLETWYAKLGKEAYTTKELLEKLSKDAEFADTLPDPLGTWFQEENKSLSRKIGRALSKKNGTPYGPNNLRIVQGEESHTKVATFKVAGYAGYAGLDSPQRETEPTLQDNYDMANNNGKYRESKQTPHTPHTPQIAKGETADFTGREGMSLAVPLDAGSQNGHSPVCEHLAQFRPRMRVNTPAGPGEILHLWSNQIGVNLDSTGRTRTFWKDEDILQIVATQQQEVQP